MNWLYLNLKGGQKVMINFDRVNRFYPAPASEGMTMVEFGHMDFCIVDMPFDELKTCVQEAEAGR